MRTPFKLISLSLCLRLIAIGAHAQNGVGSPASPSAARTAHSANSPQPGALVLIFRSVQPLTHEQMVKIQAIWDSSRAKGKAILADTSVPADKRRAKAKALQDSTMIWIRACLTPEQQGRFDAAVAALSAPAAAPAPVLQPPDPQFRTDPK